MALHMTNQNMNVNKDVEPRINDIIGDERWCNEIGYKAGLRRNYLTDTT